MLKLSFDSGKIEIQACGSISTICSDLTVMIRKLYKKIKASSSKDAAFFATQLRDAIPDFVLSDNPLEEIGKKLSELHDKREKKKEQEQKQAEKNESETDKDLSKILSELSELDDIVQSLIDALGAGDSDSEDDD